MVRPRSEVVSSACLEGIRGNHAHCRVLCRSAEDVKDEIFDMVKPRDGLRITLSDVLESKVRACP